MGAATLEPARRGGKPIMGAAAQEPAQVSTRGAEFTVGADTYGSNMRAESTMVAESSIKATTQKTVPISTRGAKFTMGDAAQETWQISGNGAELTVEADTCP